VGSESDAQLLEAWRAGDRAAAEALTRRHYASVLRYFELNASWAADDLAQRTFMACVERASDVREASAFRAYLMGIARRQLALHLRELATSKKYRGFDDAPPARTQLSTLVARNHEQFLALRALAALPRRPQLLLVLFYWEGMRTPELAASFGVPVSTIRTQMARARDLLRRRMDELAGSGMRIWTDDERLPELLASVLGDAPNGPELAAGGTR
jgi:RNA polymerase sigma factor (sigma-70 family)